ncbi:hypothetical protein HQ531_00720 [bacterium]|nr:hypothetical protein [bacterium]
MAKLIYLKYRILQDYISGNYYTQTMPELIIRADLKRLFSGIQPTRIQLNRDTLHDGIQPDDYPGCRLLFYHPPPIAL